MWSEKRLNQLLTQPSQALIDDLGRLKGDLMVLGAGGKMGPTLCLLAKRALEKAGSTARVYAASRFTDPVAKELLEQNGIQLCPGDLLEEAQLKALPQTPNVLYMAGRKFGTDGGEWQTWAMNATLPAMVAAHFKASRIVVFSSGNLYPLSPLSRAGCLETDRPGPIGEYAMSCLARERAFEYAAHQFGTPVFLYRLNFAVDLRYGVLFDIASRVQRGEPISLRTPVFNCIWQGDANEIALRALLHCQAPAKVMNVTGPEIVSVRKTAEAFGKMFGKTPVFEGEPQNTAYISDPSLAIETFGYPAVSLRTLIRWQGEWMLAGGRTLSKPTHFEERGGSY